MSLAACLKKTPGIAATFMVAATLLLPGTSLAALKCQELVAQRSCTDSASKACQVAPGQTVMVAAPIIDGFSTPCWNWNRQFQCVETNPILTCDSGANFNTVKSSCSLTAASITATVKINALTYITDATYTYRCAFGDYQTQDTLPPNKECVPLGSEEVTTASAPAAPTGANPSSGSGNPPTTAPLSSSVVTAQSRTDEYVCYSPPQTVCSDTCFEQVVNPSTGQIEQREVSCAAPVTNCVTSSNQCNGEITRNPDGTFSASREVGPDGRCVSSSEVSMCQSGPVPRCLTKENCTLDSVTPASIQDNGVATSQEQRYICSNTTTSCAEISTVSNCVSPNAWGWDNMTLENQIGQGLGEYNQAMSRMEGIEKGMKDGDPYIFSGEDLRCRYAIGNFLNTFIAIALVVAAVVMSGGAATGLVGTAIQSGATAAFNAGAITMSQFATVYAAAPAMGAAISVGSAFAADAPNSRAFGSDCCKDYIIEGSDKWFSMGSCTADEVRLAVARQKGLHHYLGEYCSKKSGFPVKQCVEKTRSFCVFDDMLALVVNEQGRAQLDTIASADSNSTTGTAPIPFELFGGLPANPTKYTGVLNTGKWIQLASQSNSQVWAWQYPGYCKSQGQQTAAYDLYMDELDQISSTAGLQPDQMSSKDAFMFLYRTVGVVPFQECGEVPGMLSFLTCSKADDSCDAARLPEGPTGVEVDISGESATTADLDWRVQQTRSYFLPGDYGVTAVMPTDASFAAVSTSVNAYISATGSCHTTGNCLYRFAITDKQANGGLGARKRTKDYANFPLYSVIQSSAWPSIDYLAPDGSLDMAAYQSDPNRGLGMPLTVNTQRFIFRPNLQTTSMTGNIHSHVLLEWASANLSAASPENDYTPLLVPTSLPAATDGWYPHGGSDPRKRFYLSGSCDPNSRWCSYAVEVDLNVMRHPWGAPKDPRCWGFTIEQMAALDFDQMDLSRWINSLDLGAVSNGLSEEAAQAMGAQVATSAQSFYGAFSTGSALNNPNAGTLALVTNTDILPKLTNDNYRAYTLEAAVPANWPNWFDDQPNINPVTNVRVDWGDGSPLESMTVASTGRAYYAEHDYGDRPIGTYRITVTLDTAGNGPQTMTTNVAITPDQGEAPKQEELDFNNPGPNGQATSEYVPAMMPDGTLQSPDALQNLAPGMVELYEQQGPEVAQ